MVQKKFKLLAKVSSDNLPAIKPALEELFANRGTIHETGQGFEVEAELEGETAADLNRTVLSALRRVEKRTRIRAEWTQGGITEKFFDYVPRGVSKTPDK